MKQKVNAKEVGPRVGAAVRGIRHEAGLSLVEVAALAGMPVSQLSNLETGKARWSLDRFVDVARALGRRPADVLRMAVPT